MFHKKVIPCFVSRFIFKFFIVNTKRPSLVPSHKNMSLIDDLLFLKEGKKINHKMLTEKLTFLNYLKNLNLLVNLKFK